MTPFISFNHNILPLSEEARFSAVSSAALYGRGVFTTLAVYRSTPFLWENHWRRLVENSERIGLDLTGYEEANILRSIKETVHKNGFENARVRLTFFDTSSSPIWKTESRAKTSLLIQAADFRVFPDHLELTVSPFSVNSRSPLAGIKSCSYLEHILAFEAAGKDGFDEAVRLNEFGVVTSASLANIFWINKKELFTPALETGCLPGTTREFVIGLATENGFSVDEVKADLTELLSADEIFLTSSGIGIADVSRIDEKEFQNNQTRSLQETLAKKIGSAGLQPA